MIRERWRSIRDALAQQIKDGTLKVGAKLPTETDLVATYGTGRHSVRRALAELAKLGLVTVEQGRGSFVQPQPMIDYAIGKRTRLRQNLQAQGIDVAGDFLGSQRVLAEGRAAAALGLLPPAEMLVTRRLTHADGVAISFGALWHDATRFPDFSERRQVFGSVSATYHSYGIEDYLRGNTEMHARRAKPEEAQRLGLHAELPVMVLRSVDTELDGAPLAFSEVIWAANRVKFSISNDEDKT
jgi:GntR family phosphonate transport system transcriptional regulator